MNTTLLLITAEHGGNRVPRRYAPLFQGAADLLASHRGYDPGSLALARRFATALGAPLFSSTVTRLLVELNRSPHHPRLFSQFTRQLDDQVKRDLLETYYWPHRRGVEAWIRQALDAGDFVLHIGVHSFTPLLDGRPRRTDVGWLYDPARAPERQAANDWIAALKSLRPDLVLRRNHPYLGVSDGLTTYLRRLFPPERYAGIELEVNQRWPQSDPKAWRRLQQELVATINSAQCTTARQCRPASRSSCPPHTSGDDS